MNKAKGMSIKMKVIVYGFGQKGKDFVQDLIETNENIELIAVTDSYINISNLKIQYNISFIEPSDIQRNEYDCIIVTPEKYNEEITNILFKQGVKKNKIKSLFDFEKENGKYYCNLCENNIFTWKYIGENYDIFNNRHIIGAGRRRGGCPICKSNDRARFVYYVMREFTQLLYSKDCSILHFAPEYMISKKLRLIHKERYISADIIPGRADIIADIRHLTFPNETFDYIICNHIMEHIIEEKMAFMEIKRCLKSRGILFFSVPICLEQDTYENSLIKTKAERIKYFGQEDHVRLYGKDIIKRIEQYGFNVRMILCSENIDEKDWKKMGLIKDDRVFLCEKII